MFFGFNEDQQSLKDLVRDVLAGKCSADVVRASWGDESVSYRVWEGLSEVGLPGMLVSEDDGGLGLDEVFFVAAMLECGYAAAPVPVVETVVAAPLLGVAQNEMAEQVRDGSLMVSADPTLDGVVPFSTVSAAAVCGGSAHTAMSFLAPINGETVETWDGARPVARVSETGVALRGVSDDIQATYWARGVIGQSAILLGLAKRCLDLTVAYVKEREQFGQPIGSFQAVKHHCSNMALQIEAAEPMVMWAGYQQATDPGSQMTWRAISSAKTLATECADFVSKMAIQCHGGIGYTTEYDLHLFTKRIWAVSTTWGSASFHKAEVARSLEIAS